MIYQQADNYREDVVAAAGVLDMIMSQAIRAAHAFPHFDLHRRCARDGSVAPSAAARVC